MVDPRCIGPDVDKRRISPQAEVSGSSYLTGEHTAVEAGEWVAHQAVQLFGGLGYMAESEVERQYRDMRILGIGGGTTEILTELAAKRVGDRKSVV